MSKIELENRLREQAEELGLRLHSDDNGRYWLFDPDADRQADDPPWPFAGRPAHHFRWSGTDLDGIEEFLISLRDEERR